MIVTVVSMSHNQDLKYLIYLILIQIFIYLYPKQNISNINHWLLSTDVLAHQVHQNQFHT